MRRLLEPSIRAKSLAAFGALLLCLIGLGLHSLIAMDHTAKGLARVSAEAVESGNLISKVKTEIDETQLGLFRYVTWASNAVSGSLLEPLDVEVRERTRAVTAAIASLGEQVSVPADQKPVLEQISKSWRKYASAVADTLDVGSTDPAMATMMLGATDDDFQNISREIQRLSEAVTSRSVSGAERLLGETQLDQRLLMLGGGLAILFSFGVSVFFTRDIVEPVRAVTAAMTELSSGDATLVLPHDGRGDEIGQMVEAIRAFRDRMRRDHDLLNESERRLRVQNARFDVALSNMSQGLAMFDKDRKLIVCNRRYAEVYGIPFELCKPGTTQRQILERRVTAGACGGPNAEEYVVERTKIASKGKPSQSVHELEDGRVVQVCHRPLPDGGWVSTHEDITESRRAAAQIEHMARHDALTDLPNRSVFRAQLEEGLARSRRGELLAVHCLDLDRFKAVNDTLGHPVGDMLLRSVARRLKGCVRDTDTVSRFGGDEFAILQAGLKRPEDAADLAKRIDEALRHPHDLDGHHVLVGTSIGIAVAPEDGTEPDQLLKNADLALYRAKADNRGTHRFFEPEMDAKLQNRRMLELDLRKALTEGQFELHYQPLVNLERDEISGFEALVRWRHPDRGLLGPAEFMPVAEEVGLIVPLGEFVLRQACADAANWPDQIQVAVNISPAQFKSPNLSQAVISALASAGLRPSRLEIEITETVLLQNNEANLAALDRLRSLGIRISMDDFGTGYSSLSYLRSFPFDKIKIDRSFVTDLPHDHNAIQVVRAMKGLASSLGMVTTAEGVETQAQLDWLRSEEFAEVQGFFFSEARPAAEVRKILRSHRKPARAVA